MTSPAEKPAVPYGYLSRRLVQIRVNQALSLETHRRREGALVAIIRALVDRIEENEAIIEAGSQPCCEGPRRLEP